jgi:hypothetical protein
MDFKEVLYKIVQANRFEPKDQLTLDVIEYSFKLHFPGDFKLKWHPDYEMDQRIDIAFNSEADELEWILKYS